MWGERKKKVLSHPLIAWMNNETQCEDCAKNHNVYVSTIPQYSEFHLVLLHLLHPSHTDCVRTRFETLWWWFVCPLKSDQPGRLCIGLICNVRLLQCTFIPCSKDNWTKEQRHICGICLAMQHYTYMYMWVCKSCPL